jgi:glycerol uptake facilitator protein
MARAPPRAAGLRRTVWGELLAEFLGTLVLIAFGDGVVAMAVAALNQSGRGTQIFAASGDWLLIAWGWALAVTFGVYVAGGVSGAHINPAVTLALAVRRDFPWRKVIPYWVAQVVGAFVGAALVYLVYHQAVGSFEAAKHITRGTLGGAADSTPTFSIFATFPAPYFGSSTIGPLIDQIVGTAFLLMFVLALTDQRNQPPSRTRRPCWSAWPWPPSACRSAPTPATPSTRPATSARGSSPGWPAGAAWRCPACTATSGCRSSGR